jgi:hypothetical protein
MVRQCGPCLGDRHAAFRESTAVPRAAAAAAAPAAARVADGDLLAAFLQLPEARQQVWIQGFATRPCKLRAHYHDFACAWRQPGMPYLCQQRSTRRDLAHDPELRHPAPCQMDPKCRPAASPISFTLTKTDVCIAGHCEPRSGGPRAVAAAPATPAASALTPRRWLWRSSTGTGGRTARGRHAARC